MSVIHIHGRATPRSGLLILLMLLSCFAALPSGHVRNAAAQSAGATATVDQSPGGEASRSRPVLSSPGNGYFTGDGNWPVLRWNSSHTGEFQLQIAYNASFTSILFDKRVWNQQYFDNDYLLGTFYWRVRVPNGQWSQSRYFINGYTPGVPTPHLPVDGGGTEDGRWPELVWFGVSGADQYQLQVSRRSDFRNTVVNTFVTDNRYSPTSAGWMQARTGYFFWRVRAVGGAWSDYRTFYSLPTPQLVSPDDRYITTDGLWPTLNWSRDGYTRFEIAVSKSASFRACVICRTVNGTSFRPSDLTWMRRQTGTFYWRVRIPGERWSNIRSFTNPGLP